MIADTTNTSFRLHISPQSKPVLGMTLISSHGASQQKETLKILVLYVPAIWSEWQRI